jgi:hypothetical protein
MGGSGKTNINSMRTPDMSSALPGLLTYTGSERKNFQVYADILLEYSGNDLVLYLGTQDAKGTLSLIQSTGKSTQGVSGGKIQYTFSTFITLQPNTSIGIFGALASGPTELNASATTVQLVEL